MLGDSRSLVNPVLLYLCLRSRVEGNALPHFPPYPHHSSHVKSCLDRPCHFAPMLARFSGRLCRRCVLSWMDRRLYGTEIQDCFRLPLSCSRRRSERGTTPPCCGAPALCTLQRLVLGMRWHCRLNLASRTAAFHRARVGHSLSRARKVVLLLRLAWPPIPPSLPPSRARSSWATSNASGMHTDGDDSATTRWRNSHYKVLNIL